MYAHSESGDSDASWSSSVKAGFRRDDSSADEQEEEDEVVCPYNPGHRTPLPPEDDDDESSDEAAEDSKMAAMAHARAYQIEMLEESLKQNTIVTMETGTGKTLVAVLRIMRELERTPPTKIIWLLATTVELCTQQHEYLKLHIPSVDIKLITGESNVDSWTEQRIWDALLANVRIVVSTHQILLDALIHGFVKLQTLSLIVFDEAHHCIKRHAGSRIMTEFYHQAKEKGLPVPSILGLTASPIIGSKLTGLDELERTLDAVCRGPTIHREDFMSHVHRPGILIHLYGANNRVAAVETSSGPGTSSNMSRLKDAFQKMDIMDDPYVHHLRQQNTPKSRRRLKEAVMKHDTGVQQRMNMFYRRSLELSRELGPWAAEYYIYEVINRFLANQDSVSDYRSLKAEEDAYLASTFQSVRAVRPHNFDAGDSRSLSAKTQMLVDILESYEGEPVCITFVKERATASVLSHLLSIHPRLHDRYQAAPVVGAAREGDPKQKLLDLPLSNRGSSSSLQRFRSGEVNVLVATSVLEEGIDVPACNLVICVDPPSNPKSFIQRRGRARMQSSQLHLIVDDKAHDAIVEFEALEAEMKKIYQDEMRQQEEMRKVEESETIDLAPLVVEETGARMTVHDAKSHLVHFCSVVSGRAFADSNPEFITHQVTDSSRLRLNEPPMLTATVLLPASVPPRLRKAESSRAWQAEANAWKDAAFQAYIALYQAGLVNDNLLPIKPAASSREVEGRESLAEARDLFNPWPDIARGWASEPQQLYARPLRVLDGDGSVQCELVAVLPQPIPEMTPLTFYWQHDDAEPWVVELGPETSVPAAAVADASINQTGVMLIEAYGHRWPIQKRHQLVRFLCTEGPLSGIQEQQLIQRDFDPDLFDEGQPLRLVRDSMRHPHYYEEYLPSKPEPELLRKPQRQFEELPEDVPYVAVKPKKWPRKAGFFHRTADNPQDKQQQQLATAATAATSSRSVKPYGTAIPASECKVDAVPAVYAQFGMLIPPLTHVLEVHLVAQALMTRTRFREVGVSDVSLVATAISAPSAREHTNYERIEFLGDAVLKLCAAVNCAAQNLNFPEGFLSLWKDRLVANSRLSRAALEFGLDRYIIKKEFTLKAWRDLYSADLLEDEDESGDEMELDDPSQRAPGEAKRKLSTKTLADVVEALIGAAYIDGGLAAALRCIAVFLPEMEWQTLEAGRDILFAAALANSPLDLPLPPTLEPLEELIGYTFTRKSLLVEAMTHASYNVPGAGACFERLEFLGDAVLDSIVVNVLFDVGRPGTEGDTGHSEPLPHDEMHLLRTAVVNGDFLGFLVMEWSVRRPTFRLVAKEVEQGGDGEEERKTVTLEQTISETPLWRFMRFASDELGLEQRATAARHAALRGPIASALFSSPSGETSYYPWAPLARLRVPKFYSDLLEALVGAVWVDSGSLDAPRALLERAGVLPCLRRLLRERVHVLHPKEELGRRADRERVRYVVGTRRRGRGKALRRGLSALEEGEEEGKGKGKGKGKEKEPDQPPEESTGESTGEDEGDEAYERRISFACRVFVGPRCVASVSDGVSREEVKVKAAEEALRLWRARGRVWEGIEGEEGGEDRGGGDLGEDMEVDKRGGEVEI